MSQISWTKAEIARFDDLVDQVSSRNQLDRIAGRLDMGAFIKEHGKAKCDAMFAHLEAGGAIEASSVPVELAQSKRGGGE